MDKFAGHIQVSFCNVSERRGYPWMLSLLISLIIQKTESRKSHCDNNSWNARLEASLTAPAGRDNLDIIAEASEQKIVIFSGYNITMRN